MLKNRIILVFMSLFLTNASWQLLAANDEQPSKTEVIYQNRNDNGVTEFRLSCTILYNNELKPEQYVFGFLAQDNNYSYLQSLFPIYIGNASGLYILLNEILDFSENFKEEDIIIPKETYSIKNYKYPLLGWRTSVITSEGQHSFKPKQFKKMIKKFEDYCKKNNISYR